MFGKVGNWLNRLIKNNSGLSSKSFFLVVVTAIGCLLLLVPVFTLSIEAIFTHTIATDLSGMAAYIGAVASLFATAGLTKAWSEKYEQPRGGYMEPGHPHDHGPKHMPVYEGNNGDEEQLEEEL